MGKKQTISGEQRTTLTNEILQVYVQNPHSALNYKQVSKRIGVDDRAGKDLVRLLIEELYRTAN